MKVLGIIFLAIIGVGVVAGVALGLASLGDIRRYLRMRSM
jgi:hypothetical protein